MSIILILAKVVYILNRSPLVQCQCQNLDGGDQQYREKNVPVSPFFKTSRRKLHDLNECSRESPPSLYEIIATSAWATTGLQKLQDTFLRRLKTVGGDESSIRRPCK